MYCSLSATLLVHVCVTLILPPSEEIFAFYKFSLTKNYIDNKLTSYFI